MAYESVTLRQEFVVERVISLHYFEYMNDFSFAGEAHDFWEFLCVDKGTVNVIAGNSTYSLNKGEIIFHKPNEFHNVKANGIVAPNLVVIGFECSSPAISFFQNKLLHIGPSERDLLARIIQETKHTFCCGLDDPYCEKLVRYETTPFGSEQLIRIYLEQFLIQLTRSCYEQNNRSALPKSMRVRSEDELFNRIVSYMEENLNRQITIDSICSDNLVGRSMLQKLFREHTHQGVIDYFTHMKINAAKQLIRNQQMNFTQIADFLGYNSIHYFSRQFKKTTGMSPTEYASSIKLLSESPIILPQTPPAPAADTKDRSNS